MPACGLSMGQPRIEAHARLLQKASPTADLEKITFDDSNESLLGV